MAAGIATGREISVKASPLQARDGGCCLGLEGVAISRGLRHKRLSSVSSRRGCGCSSGVEHNLAKVGVEGSNPFARSKIPRKINRLEASLDRGQRVLVFGETRGGS